MADLSMESLLVMGVQLINTLGNKKNCQTRTKLVINLSFTDLTSSVDFDKVKDEYLICYTEHMFA